MVPWYETLCRIIKSQHETIAQNHTMKPYNGFILWNYDMVPQYGTIIWVYILCNYTNVPYYDSIVLNHIIVPYGSLLGIHTFEQQYGTMELYRETIAENHTTTTRIISQKHATELQHKIMPYNLSIQPYHRTIREPEPYHRNIPQNHTKQLKHTIEPSYKIVLYIMEQYHRTIIQNHNVYYETIRQNHSIEP